MRNSPALDIRLRSEIEARGYDVVQAEVLAALMRNAATCRSLAVRMRAKGDHLQAGIYDNQAAEFEVQAHMWGAP